MEKGFYRSFRKDTFFLLFTFLYTTSLVVPQILCSPIVAGTKMSLLLILMSIYKNSYLLWSSTAPFILSFLSLALFHLFLLWTMCNTSSCQEHTSSFSLTVAGELTQQLRWFLCIVGKRCCSDKTSWEMLGWMKLKLKSKLPREISITSDMQMILPFWQKVNKN